MARSGWAVLLVLVVGACGGKLLTIPGGPPPGDDGQLAQGGSSGSGGGSPDTGPEATGGGFTCFGSADCAPGLLCCFDVPPGSSCRASCFAPTLGFAVQLCASSQECASIGEACTPGGMMVGGRALMLCRGPSASMTCAASCPSGCCDETGQCQGGQSDVACGAGGTLCQNCRTNLSYCYGGHCGYEKDGDAGFVPTCNANACSSGCNKQLLLGTCCRSDQQCGCASPVNGACQ